MSIAMMLRKKDSGSTKAGSSKPMLNMKSRGCVGVTRVSDKWTTGVKKRRRGKASVAEWRKRGGKEGLGAARGRKVGRKVGRKRGKKGGWKLGRLGDREVGK